jgi:opacity protein-like surface antigen
MGTGIHRWAMVSVLCFAVGIAAIAASLAQAEPWTTENGGIEPGQFVLGMRAGFAPLTQSLTSDSSTDIGSLVNFQAMYSLNKWLLVGMMLEWERHAVDQNQPPLDLGHQDTVSVLPTIELRPVKYGPIVPYVNMSFGVNVNSFGESNAIGGNRISPSNTFAWRLGWGGDYMLTNQFALNTEMAYKRNDGHATVTAPSGAQTTRDWNASSFGFLFGVKMFF